MRAAKKTKPKRSLAELKAVLKDSGLRATQARMAVLGHFFVVTGPQTHGQVADSLHDRGFDRTTVYRNLIELSEAGLLSRMELGDHVWRFELSGPPSDPSHPHFVCIDCGEVSCLSELNLNSTLLDEKLRGIRDVTEVLLKGHCKACR
jgi:Fur family transcriptional regulator, ferric uptake regulator